MRPFVSILIPAYNAQEWIAETITSALAQTWTHTEIVIVDDGSTDRTVEIARRFTSPKIRIQQQDHRGASAARNHAYALSRGDYIQWLDADDLLASRRRLNASSRAPQKSASDRILFSCSSAKFMYRRSRAQFVPTALCAGLDTRRMAAAEDGAEYLHADRDMAGPVPRRLADAAGPWDTRLLSDDDGESHASAAQKRPTGVRSGSSRVSANGYRAEPQLRRPIRNQAGGPTAVD